MGHFRLDTYLLDSLGLSSLVLPSRVDMSKLRLLGVSLGLIVCAGCTSVASSPGIFPSDYPTVSRTTPASSCEALGPLTAEADCACYDKMSYLRVEAKASDNLAHAAHSEYPETDIVQVSEVDVFLNNAVAHGVAYKCDTIASGS